MAVRRRLVWAGVVLLVEALVFFGTGLVFGAFSNVPLVLVGGFLTIGGLALTVIGARGKG